MAKYPAAFINSVEETGTKREAIKYLQETWDELCDARAALSQEREACMKAICSGCASGVPINEFGYHQHNAHTFPCHATAIRARGQETDDGVKG